MIHMTLPQTHFSLDRKINACYNYLQTKSELPLESFAWHGLGPAQWDAVNLVRSGRKQQ